MEQIAVEYLAQRVFDDPTAPDMVFRLDQYGNVLEGAARNADHLVVPLDRIIGNALYHLVPAQIGLAFFNRMRAVTKWQTITDHDYVLQTPTGLYAFRTLFVPCRDQTVITFTNVLARLDNEGIDNHEASRHLPLHDTIGET